MAIDSSVTTGPVSLGIGGLIPQGPRTQDTPTQPPSQEIAQVAQRPVILQSGDSEAFNQADDFRREQNSGFERQRGRSNRAIQAYQSFARDERRQEVQQLLGVDTFA